MIRTLATNFGYRVDICLFCVYDHAFEDMTIDTTLVGHFG